MNEQKHTSTGAWALNALDAEEREQVARYLAEDPEAAAEARSFEETAGELAGSLPPLSPRPALKSAVMARIGTTRQLSPLPEHEDAPAETGADAAPGAAPGAASTASPTTAPEASSATTAPPSPPAPTEQVVSLDRYRASVRRHRWTAVAAAALLLTTIAGVGLWGGERSAQREMQETLAAMESEQATAQQEREMLSSILASDDASHLSVPVPDGGSLQLMFSRDQEAMIVQPAGLPELPDGRDYQLWMIDEAGPHSAGVLETVDAPVLHEGEIPDGASIGLSVEPAGGSSEPTTVIAVGEV
ncbi:anti-sigma factor domain-containing protein [Brachybacterium sp. AOP43-C2-M15]|uniref:anti-sigma factor n=1 Tax=Brachybacterium sp. AOP43-C2-M15 TaxID=3457661 RepID=UPI0040342D4F